MGNAYSKDMISTNSSSSTSLCIPVSILPLIYIRSYAVLQEQVCIPVVGSARRKTDLFQAAAWGR